MGFFDNHRIKRAIVGIGIGLSMLGGMKASAKQMPKTERAKAPVESVYKMLGHRLPSGAQKESMIKALRELLPKMGKEITDNLRAGHAKTAKGLLKTFNHFAKSLEKLGGMNEDVRMTHTSVNNYMKTTLKRLDHERAKGDTAPTEVKGEVKPGIYVFRGKGVWHKNFWIEAKINSEKRGLLTTISMDYRIQGLPESRAAWDAAAKRHPKAVSEFVFEQMAQEKPQFKAFTAD